MEDIEDAAALSIAEKKARIETVLQGKGITPSTIGGDTFFLLVTDLVSLVIHYQQEQVSRNFAAIKAVLR